jgi:hypothetical protein
MAGQAHPYPMCTAVGLPGLCWRLLHAARLLSSTALSGAPDAPASMLDLVCIAGWLQHAELSDEVACSGAGWLYPEQADSFLVQALSDICRLMLDLDGEGVLAARLLRCIAGNIGSGRLPVQPPSWRDFSFALHAHQLWVLVEPSVLSLLSATREQTVVSDVVAACEALMQESCALAIQWVNGGMLQLA